MGLSRSVCAYRSQRQQADELLMRRLVELAGERKRFGYRRLHVLLRREGHQVNHKKTYRLYREAKLSVRRRKRRRGIAVERALLQVPDRANQVWSADFVMDALANGRRLKLLTVVDDFTKESVTIEVGHSLTGEDVAAALDQAAQVRGYPKVIRTDQGPEFTSRAFDQWAYERQIVIRLIQPGKPTQNAFIESFNGKLRDACLNAHWFRNLAHAQDVIAVWRCDYNEARPHSALRYQTPAQFAAMQLMDPHGNEH
jgi:putative transposase